MYSGRGQEQGHDRPLLSVLGDFLTGRDQTAIRRARSEPEVGFCKQLGMGPGRNHGASEAATGIAVGAIGSQIDLEDSRRCVRRS